MCWISYFQFCEQNNFFWFCALHNVRLWFKSKFFFLRKLLNNCFPPNFSDIISILIPIFRFSPKLFKILLNSIILTNQMSCFPFEDGNKYAILFQNIQICCNHLEKKTFFYTYFHRIIVDSMLVLRFSSMFMLGGPPCPLT